MTSDFDEAWQLRVRAYHDELEHIKRALQNSNNDELGYRMKQAGNQISLLERLIKERRNQIPSSKRSEYRQLVESYKQKLNKLNLTYYNSVNKTRNKSNNSNPDERHILLHGNDIQNNTDNMLKQCLSMIDETTNTAMITSGQLVDQGDQLENVLDELHETNQLSDRARRIMLGMARRMMTDRIIQFIIVFVELAIIGLVVWWKFFKK